MKIALIALLMALVFGVCFYLGTLMHSLWVLPTIPGEPL